MMASIRKLPSGNFQASVLLDNGRRITNTERSYDEAIAWAAAAEQKRDEERAARRNLDADQSIAINLASLENHAREGRLTEEHKAHLRRIAEL